MFSCGIHMFILNCFNGILKLFHAATVNVIFLNVFSVAHVSHSLNLHVVLIALSGIGKLYKLRFFLYIYICDTYSLFHLYLFPF